MSLPPFHVAVPVDDLARARDFYGGVLGCDEGRSTDRWIDFNLYGHQLVCHLTDARRDLSVSMGNVDGEQVPVPHYGVVLTWSDWEQLAQRLEELDVSFVVEPGIRFVGSPGEQATMFLTDPAGNALEFKALRDPAQLFAR